MSSLRDGLTACNLALQCVHGAALINQDNTKSVSSQQQKVTEAIEEVGNKRFKNGNGMSPAIYHSQAVLNLLKDTREPGAAAASGDMHVRFGKETVVVKSLNHRLSQVEYTEDRN
ncbi:hypothetical protein N7485_005005 [Penicillium canescens]|nr:hypothetical protein N7485_005005 [Penicillium canescens]